MGIRTRLLLLLGLGGVLWGAVNLALSWGVFEQRIQELAIGPLRAHFGAGVTVQTAQLTVMPTRLTLKNVVIPTHGPFADHVASPLSVDVVKVRFSLWSVLTEAIVIHKLSLHGIRASLWYSAEQGGIARIPSLLPRAWPRDAIIREMTFENGTVSVRSADPTTSPYFVEFSELEGRLRSDFAMQTFQLNVQRGATRVTSVEDPTITHAFSDLKAKILIDADRIDVQRLSLDSADGTLFVVQGDISTPDAPEISLLVDAQGSLNDLDRWGSLVERLPFSAHDVQGRFHLRMELTGTWPDVRFVGNLGLDSLSVNGLRAVRPRIRFYGEPGHFILADISTEFLGGRLQGSIRVNGTFHQRPTAAVAFDYAGPIGHATLSGTMTETDLDIAARASDVDVEEVMLMAGLTEPMRGWMRLDGKISGNPRAPVFRGVVSMSPVIIKDRAIDSVWSEFAYGHRHLEIGKAVIRQGQAQFDVKGSIAFSETLSEPSLDLNISVRNGSIKDVVGLLYRDLPLPERASGSLTVKRPSARGYWVKGSLSLPGGFLYGEEFDEGEVEFVLDQQGISFGRFHVRHGAGSVYFSGRFDFDGGYSGSLHARRIVVQDRTWIKEHIPGLQGMVMADLVGSGNVQAPLIHGTVVIGQLRHKRAVLGNGWATVESTDRSVTATVPKLHLRVDGYDLRNEGPVALEFRDHGISIRNAKLTGMGTSLTITGRIVPFAEYDVAVVGAIHPSLLSVVSEEVVSARGRGTADLHIFDRWDRPRLNGTLTLEDLIVSCKTVDEPFSIPSIAVVFKNDHATVEPFSGHYAQGRFRGDGEILIRQGRVHDFSIAATFSDIQRAVGTGLLASMDGRVRLEGGGRLRKISGTLTVTNVEATTRESWKAFVTTDVKPLVMSRDSRSSHQDAELDLHVTGGKTLSLRNDLVQLPLTIDFLIRGTMQRPIVLGEVAARGGSIRLGDHWFNVLDGGLDLVGDQGIQALYSLHANTSLPSVDVDLLVTGANDQFTVSWASNPSMEEATILARLGVKSLNDSFARLQFGRRAESPIVDVTPPRPGTARTLLAHRVEAEKRLFADRVHARYSTTAVPEDEQRIQVEYPLNKHLSFVGERNEEGRVAGDFRFKIEFP